MNKFESGKNIVPNKQLEQKIETQIEALKEPIRDLLKQLHEHIDSGAYKLLIGGDTSGRIPTLIFNKVIKKIYQEKDFHVPQTMALFICRG